MEVICIIPPVYLLVCIALMILFRFLLSGAKLLGLPWNLSGLIPLALGIALNLAADRSFKNRNISVKPLEKTTALITDGVFRVSRHPMYLGMVLILLGVAILLGTLTPFVVVFAFAFLMDIAFIRFEEKKLEETFGEAYLEYKKKVRRWV